MRGHRCKIHLTAITL